MIAFQKLNGQGTAAAKQLAELEKISLALTELSGKINLPDIKALFKMLFPTLPVIPFYKIITVYFTDNEEFYEIGKKVFGKVQISHLQENLPPNDNGTASSRSRVWYENSLIYQVGTHTRGEGIQAWNSANAEFIGLVSKVSLSEFGGTTPKFQSTFVIYGFELPEDFTPDIISVVEPPPVANLNLINFSIVNQLYEVDGVSHELGVPQGRSHVFAAEGYLQIFESAPAVDVFIDKGLGAGPEPVVFNALQYGYSPNTDAPISVTFNDPPPGDPFSTFNFNNYSNFETMNVSIGGVNHAISPGTTYVFEAYRSEGQIPITFPTVAYDKFDFQTVYAVQSDLFEVNLNTNFIIAEDPSYSGVSILFFDVVPQQLGGYMKEGNAPDFLDNNFIVKHMSSGVNIHSAFADGAYNWNIYSNRTYRLIQAYYGGEGATPVWGVSVDCKLSLLRNGVTLYDQTVTHPTPPPIGAIQFFDVFANGNGISFDCQTNPTP